MLGYRTLFSVEAAPDAVLEQSVREFRRWLVTKPNQRYDGDALEFGVVTRYDTDAAALLLQESQPDGSRAVRATLTEVNSVGRWTTRLTAAAPREGRPWVWLDVDGPAERADGSGRRQWTSTPNLAKSLLGEFAAFDGVAELGIEPWRAFPEDVDRIIDVICDDSRRGLLFLAGTAPEAPLQPWIDKVADIVRDTAGLAAAYVLDAEATQLLNARMFGTHGVDPGTVRTYRPGADPASELDARRHRTLGRERLENDSPRFLRSMLGWRARESAIEQPLPRPVVRLDGRFEALTNSVLVTQLTAPAQREMPAPAESAPAAPSPVSLKEPVDVGALVEPETPAAAAAVVREAELLTRLAAMLGQALGRELAAEELEAELTRLAEYAIAAEQWLATRDVLTSRLDTLGERAAQAEAQVELLRGELEGEQLDHAQTSEDLVRAESICGKLRVQLISAGQGEAAWSVDGEDATRDLPSSFSDLLRRIPELDLVSFTGDAEVTVDLEDHDPLGAWAGKAWRALLAINGYAQAKVTGRFDGNVDSYLRETPAGLPGFSAQRHARDESEAVKSSPAFRAARVFRVPTRVDSTGKVFMPAHFKIAQFGMISPRLHYYDATGADGRIYVGYLGRHLPTKNTN